MPLLDGLNDSLRNPLYDSIMESLEDENLDFEFALEAVVDNKIELSDEDIAAILDDDNPDNIAADIGRKDEAPSQIEDEVLKKDLGILESLMSSLESDFGFDNDLDDEEAPVDVGGDDNDIEGDECDLTGECDLSDVKESTTDDDDISKITIDSLLDAIV